MQPPNAVDSGLKSVGNHEGSASGQDVAARMRAIPVENNKPEMIRLVSSDGAVVSRVRNGGRRSRPQRCAP